MINKKLVKFLIFAVFLSFGLLVILHINVEAKPGTQSDPLVTLSYVDKRFAQMNKYLESKYELKGNSSQNTSTNSYAFKVLNIPAGTMIYFADSSECIIRSGKLLVIASKSGGLVDISAGEDLPDGTQVPNNHLILNPLNDGRGMVVMEDAWVLIRGDYTSVTN